MAEAPILIIGGGLVGLAVALKLSGHPYRAKVIVLEKERAVGAHQSSHNSGVLHAGLYYKPGSAKARLVVNGLREMTSFCRDHGIAHEICGKLVVAVDESERERLLALHRNGEANGLGNLRLLRPEEMRAIEPNVAGVAALHVPEEGIADYPAVARTMAALVEANGGEVRTGAGVRELSRKSNGWMAGTAAGNLEGRYIVNCAGLHCDRVSQLAGEKRTVRIVPFRGEYYKLRRGREHLVRNLIYPVPDLNFPFLGVHFTRLIHGGIEAGPNAVLAFAREGYRKSDFNAADLADALSFPGLWRFFGRHAGMCVAEMRRSFSRRLFCQSLQRLVPDLRLEDLEPGGAGVRAQAMGADGSLVSDFQFVRREGALHVLNAPSPAATASLAIGAEVAQQVAAAAGLRG